MRLVEIEGAYRKERRDDRVAVVGRLRQGTDPGIRHRAQVVGRERTHLRRELRPTAGGDLVGMQPNLQAHCLRAPQQAARVLN